MIYLKGAVLFYNFFEKKKIKLGGHVEPRVERDLETFGAFGTVEV